MSKVQHINFVKLKRLEGLEISFPETGVVAIMGANGIGKSTILHALACLYHPDSKIKKDQETYKWSRYFIPHGKNLWMGSSAKVTFHGDKSIEVYAKDGDRWTPKYSRRKRRYVRFIGIGDYYPHLEKEKYHTRFHFDTDAIEDKKRQKIIQYASHVLNRKYTDVSIAVRANGTQRRLWHVEADVGSYTSYYMGGGEQKVFHILDALLEAPKGGLILIEEIEVLLHDHALRRLLKVINSVANEKELQVVFSTHWTGIADFKEDMEIRTLVASKKGIRCIQGFDANSVYDITGNPADQRQIEVWVEDTVSQRIIQQIASEIGILRNVTLKIFGDASNAFTIAAALVLNEKTAGRLVVIDGDVYETYEKKLVQMKSTLSGSSVEDQQKAAVSIISQYTPFPIMNPENFLRSMLDAGPANSTMVNEYKKFIDENVFVDGGKSVVTELASGFSRPRGDIEAVLIEHASKQEAWTAYTAEVRAKLLDIAKELGIIKPEKADEGAEPLPVPA